MSEEQPEKKLTAKEKRFVAEYLVDGKYNQTQAYIRAGYSAKGARQNASQAMSKDYIQAAIARAREELDREYGHRVMGRYEVLAELTEIAKLSDIGELLVDENGKVVDDLESVSVKRAKEMNKSKFIKKVRINTTQGMGLTKDGDPIETQTSTVEVEMYSRHEALRDLGKYHGLFLDRTDITSAGEKIPIAIVKMDIDEL